MASSLTSLDGGRLRFFLLPPSFPNLKGSTLRKISPSPSLTLPPVTVTPRIAPHLTSLVNLLVARKLIVRTPLGLTLTPQGERTILAHVRAEDV